MKKVKLLEFEEFVNSKRNLKLNEAEIDNLADLSSIKTKFKGDFEDSNFGKMVKFVGEPVFSNFKYKPLGGYKEFQALLNDKKFETIIYNDPKTLSFLKPYEQLLSGFNRVLYMRYDGTQGALDKFKKIFKAIGNTDETAKVYKGKETKNNLKYILGLTWTAEEESNVEDGGKYALFSSYPDNLQALDVKDRLDIKNASRNGYGSAEFVLFYNSVEDTKQDSGGQDTSPSALASK